MAGVSFVARLHCRDGRAWVAPKHQQFGGFHSSGYRHGNGYNSGHRRLKEADKGWLALEAIDCGVKCPIFS